MPRFTSEPGRTSFATLRAMVSLADMVMRGADEREIGAERFFQQPDLAVDLDGGFSLFDECAQAGLGEHAPQAVTAGPDPFGKRPLGYQFDLEFPGEHLPLCFWVGPDM